MRTVRTVAALRKAVTAWKADGAAIGVVPTMGALHAGHLGLAAAARRDCDRVVATIFVNPAQFDNPEDLARYPRRERADAAMLRRAGVDLLFAPPPEEVYPAGFATTVRVGGPAARMEGAHRPGHFDGVATVVTKLLMMTMADRAYFGEKDWQQLQVVRRLVADLNLPVAVVGCPTLREADGLAMSSRNRRLAPAARAAAPALHAALCEAAAAIRSGADVGAALGAARAAILAAGFERIDYLDLCDGLSLEPVAAPGAAARLFAAAWLDGVRLIDNIAL